MERIAPARVISDICARGEQELIGMCTNGHLIHQGLVPCETNPDTGGLSHTGDRAHALAAFTVTGKGFESRHVCRECAIKFHMQRRIKEGVIWS